MDIVDSQIHLGPGGIAEIKAAMDAVGIKAALIDEFWFGTSTEMPSYAVPLAQGFVRRGTAPTAELAALIYPKRFSYLLRPDRRDPELLSLIRLARDAPHARALRITPGLAKTELSALTSGGYDEMFKAAADCGLPIFVTIPGNAPALLSSVRKFSDLPFIIDHCGMPFSSAMQQGLMNAGLGDQLPDMGGASTEAEFDRVLKLSELPNVALKWGHAQGLFGVSDYPFYKLRPYLKAALDSFGAERMMWASDVSANLTGESWAELLFWLRDNPDVSHLEKERLLGGTVRRILNWPL
jgi:L-fuconolactonase